MLSAGMGAILTPIQRANLGGLSARPTADGTHHTFVGRLSVRSEVGIRLLLAEEHQIVRRNLRTLLQDHEGWQVVAEAGDGCEAVRLAEAHRPDVAVIGLAMPVLNGIETTRRIVERLPVTRVIVLSTHAEDVYVAQTRLAGAMGFVLTDAADVDLPTAVHEISAGRSFTSPTLARADSSSDRIRL